jgi:hypothetical protein
MRRGRRRGGSLLSLVVLLVALAIALPIAGVETVCRAPGPTARALPSGHFGVTEPDYARPTPDSVLSYPDWDIVYAHRDFAAMLQTGDEHSFHYLPSIVDYWTSLCAVNRMAAEQGGGEIGKKASLSLAGLGFSVEMSIKGAYEGTLGWLTAAIRGKTKTSEDVLAQWEAGDYADFIGQWPWYQYSFWKQVRRLFSLPMAGTPSVTRSVERRLALGLEWSVQSLFAQLVSAVAGLSDTPRAIDSVVGGIDQPQLAAIPDLVIVRAVAEGKWLVRTPRYDAFTRAMLALAAGGGEIYEIAGNDRIFVTVRAADGASDALPGARQLFSEPIQSRPGWRRLGEESPVAGLAGVIRGAQERGIEIDHLYDY